ncbi:Predicted helicase [Xylanibacter ruminicola]|uniref:Predicted helicase n=1 Tax=Xylanibacter ruminicola TaxID=839 RepID=A0A1H4APV6_XYLRU|nr:type ISP restriction/modification enzyme [Xylanibacter ruminicola]SEA37923.1 Predicted helicase [Xylanibacter ruminicola]
MTINDILSEIRLKSLTEKAKGSDFERLMKFWFLTDPRYSQLEEVWLWEEFPGRKAFGGKDLGIDLVAKTEYGDYWAIQCKCYAEDATIDKSAVDSFLANASRTFIDADTFQTKEFSNLVWVQTSRKKWGPNAEQAIQGLSKPFNRISLYDLEISAVDWEKLRNNIYGDEARLSGKQPMRHQLIAMSKAYEYFVEKKHDRGKLIMACGTGKTYTSLKIMEQMTDKDAFVVFLVPSIALLGQTLNAWMADKQDPLKAVCVCSDAKVTRQMIDADEEDASIIDLAVPATTNTKSILQQLRRYDKDDSRTVIFSTYQSIDVVKEAIDAYGREVDLIICDEAHRTTGVILKDRSESNFTKIHNNDFIRAKRRLYMTATPRLYRESVKIKAKENDDVLCSMDDVDIYGEEFHRLTFNDAVSQGLLTDYKVLVLTVSEDDIPQAIRTRIKEQYTMAADKDKIKELQFDDATKLIGCINGLSKRIKGDNGVTKEQDPILMKRAVAFCQTINPTKSNPNFSSKQIATYFHSICEEYKESIREEDCPDVVNVYAKHIDGSMDANTRNGLISWLKQDAEDPNECRVLCNVRCLSEGVDVPALDAVLFLSPRNSEVEVVQSVGRVMRSFGKGTDHEKKYGYIIIPVIVPNDVTPEQALVDNERFKVVWTILNALRSHDENFNAHVNQINLNKTRPSKITVAGVPHGTYSVGHEAPDRVGEEAIQLSGEEVARQLELQFGELQDGIYARLVEKVGDKLYWENWAKSVGEIAQKFIQRIATLIKENAKAREYFNDFVKGLHKNINDSVDTGQAIEMLAQHMITRPVFDALFKDYQFVNNNAVSRSMQDMIDVLEAEGMEMDTAVLDKFYTSVRNNVSNIDNLEGKQTIIKNLYEKFFKGAFPLTVEKLGIVYTPVECVDFIIHSVEDILKEEFNTSLTEENVHILDPFTGTGTFITRLLQSGLIRKEDMLRKYRNEIHCNEIVLLAYYIADVNIESVYHDLMHPDSYEMYDGICLTDTFQLNEHGDNDIFSQLFPENSKRLQRQKKAPVRVIIGNPPYSIGQKSANDDAQNLKYPHLDSRIEKTYVKEASTTLKNALYDSYIKAFRWASDRIHSINEGGIIGFISNGMWIDGNTQEGMRKCLRDEFTSIYVFNLRGNARTSGEQRRKEGGSVFGEGTRTPITITLLVKNPTKRGEARIFYHDIGDYLTREQKLKVVHDFNSISNIEWSELEPNEKNDWINMRDGLYDSLIPVSPDKNSIKPKSIFNNIVLGIATSRDNWVYSYGCSKLQSSISNMIEVYNSQLGKKDSELFSDPSKISWSANLKKYQSNNKTLKYDKSCIKEAVYRPYQKQYVYYDSSLIERPAQWKNLFPSEETENIIICVSGMGNNKENPISITHSITDYNSLSAGARCFPLYWYEENKIQQRSLFDDVSNEKYIRRDGITDWILKEIRSRYGGARNITKEMVFYYVYGILHSPAYRERFAADLKKSLPRIPIVENVNDFMDFYTYGKKLADLHLNYETVPAYPGVIVHGDRKLTGTDADYDYFRVVDKLRFKSKQDKSTIIFNGNITIENIPAKAYEYIVNGKSAIEWIVERYCVSQDTKSLIRNDANDWAREHHQPRYILDLLLSVINVSVQTVDIVNALPKLKFD